MQIKNAHLLTCNLAEAASFIATERFLFVVTGMSDM